MPANKNRQLFFFSKLWRLIYLGSENKTRTHTRNTPFAVGASEFQLSKSNGTDHDCDDGGGECLAVMDYPCQQVFQPVRRVVFAEAGRGGGEETHS